MSLSAFVNGGLLGGALIIAIGAQNLFVLRQGIARDRIFIVCLLCSVIDAALIVTGALGLGTLISKVPWLVVYASWGGAAFLLVFGGISLYAAIKPKPIECKVGDKATSTLKKVVLMTLAFGLLNPHVYLDTVILLGSLAAAYEFSMRIYFVLGAVSASFLWFFTLGYGARILAPLMQHPVGVRVLDLAVAGMMFIVATNLIWDQIMQSSL